MEIIGEIWKDSALVMQRKLILILSVMMIFDTIFGIIASIVRKRVVSSIAATGIARKVSSLLFIIMLGIIAKELELIPFFTITLIGLCFAELQSIMEILYILKVPYVDIWIRMVSQEGAFKKLEKYGIKNEKQTPSRTNANRRSKKNEHAQESHDEKTNNEP